MGEGAQVACRIEVQAPEQERTKVLQSFTQAPFELKGNGVGYAVGMNMRWECCTSLDALEC